MAVTLLRNMISIVFCLSLISVAASASDAETTVSTYHSRLLDALADPQNVTDKSRFDALAPAMDEAFDFETMTKTITGRNWTQASEATQSDLLAAFRQVSIAIYADQFADLKQGTFLVSGTRNGPRGLKLVDSTLKTPTENVSLIYVLRKKDGAWRIIDVLLDGGISELAVRASEYSNILKNSGPKGLVISLNNQTNALLAN